MQQINTENPAESPLLVMATSAHGTCDRPTLGDRDGAQLQQLVGWIERCSAGRTPPANLGSPDSLLLQLGTQRRVSATTAPPATIAKQEPVAGAAITLPHAAPMVRPVAPSPPTPAASSSAGAEDPFDPEIFNRRYHRRTG
jgi:hypothetical protein